MGQSKILGGHFPPLLPPGYASVLEGSLGVILSALSKMCVCACTHTAFRNCARAQIYCAQTHCCSWVVAQVLQILVISKKERSLSKTSAQSGYKNKRELGGTQKLSQNICLLSICWYKKKKNCHLSLSRSKIDFWGVFGRAIVPNYVKIYVS